MCGQACRLCSATPSRFASVLTIRCARACSGAWCSAHCGSGGAHNDCHPLGCDDRWNGAVGLRSICHRAPPHSSTGSRTHRGGSLTTCRTWSRSLALCSSASGVLRLTGRANAKGHPHHPGRRWTRPKTVVPILRQRAAENTPSGLNPETVTSEEAVHRAPRACSGFDISSCFSSKIFRLTLPSRRLHCAGGVMSRRPPCPLVQLYVEVQWNRHCVVGVRGHPRRDLPCRAERQRMKAP